MPVEIPGTVVETTTQSTTVLEKNKSTTTTKTKKTTFDINQMESKNRKVDIENRTTTITMELKGGRPLKSTTSTSIQTASMPYDKAKATTSEEFRYHVRSQVDAMSSSGGQAISDALDGAKKGSDSVIKHYSE